MSKSREPALQCADDGCSDPAFHVLAEAYRATGGTVGGHELARRLEAYRDAYFMSLEKLIAARIVFGFESNPLAVVQAARAERLSMGGPAR